MLTDPQIITVNAVAKSMPRIIMGDKKSTYQTNDTLFSLLCSHTLAKDRVRSMARFDQLSIVPDPLTAVNDWETLGSYIVIDRPLIGFSVTQVQQHITGFKTWLTDAMVAQLYGQES